MSRLYSERRPTEQSGIAAASRSSRLALPASTETLAVRAARAIANDDGHGIQLLTAHLTRASA